MTTYAHHREAALAALDDARLISSVPLTNQALLAAQVHATLALAAAAVGAPVARVLPVAWSELMDTSTVAGGPETLPACSPTESCCAAEVSRLTVHSVLLNTVSWRIAEAVGDVPGGAIEIEGDVEQQLGRLIGELTALRADAARRLAAKDIVWVKVRRP